MNILKKYETFSKEEYKSIKTYIMGIDGYFNMKKKGKIYEKITQYDISKFYCEDKPYGIYFHPDVDFIKILEELNGYIDEKIPLDITFDLSINKNKMNLVDSIDALPKQLQNLGLGYKLYKEVIKMCGYITSTKIGTKDTALRIWYNMMFDKDLYCYTSMVDSGVILKTYPNIKDILDQLKDKDLEFDDQLKQKIIEVYGSIEKYKQI